MPGYITAAPAEQHANGQIELAARRTLARNGGLSYSRRRRRRRRCKSAAELKHCSVVLAVDSRRVTDRPLSTQFRLSSSICVCIIKAAGFLRYDPVHKKMSTLLQTSSVPAEAIGLLKLRLAPDGVRSPRQIETFCGDRSQRVMKCRDRCDHTVVAWNVLLAHETYNIHSVTPTHEIS